MSERSEMSRRSERMNMHRQLVPHAGTEPTRWAGQVVPRFGEVRA